MDVNQMKQGEVMVKYNDYNTNMQKEAIITLIKSLKNIYLQL
ncbi:MAG: hypothetical protein Q8936_19535 [Bacillota bacterium]|nr:hypothetical protein [Bacillota bacterium]